MSGSSGTKFYSFRISADGMQELIRDLGGVAQSSTAADLAVNRLINSSPQLASALTRAQEATDAAAKKAVELRDAQERAAATAQSSAARMAALSGTLNDLEGKTQAVRRAANDFRGVLDLVGAGGVSRQIGEISGVVDGVADAMATGSLMAGRFQSALGLAARLVPPLAIAVGGIALATTDWSTALDRVGNAVRTLSGAAYDGHLATNSYRGAIDALSEALETAAQRERRLAQETRNRQVAQAAAAIEPARAQLAAAERRLAQLQPIADQVAAARAIDPDTTIGGAAARRFEDYQRVAADVARMRGEIAEVEGRIRDLQDVPFRAGAVVPPEPPSAGRPPSSGRSIADTSARDLAALERDFNRADDLARRAAEQALERERRAQAEITRAREREEAQRERDAERTTDRITSYLADSFTDAYTQAGGGFQALLRNLQQTAATTPIRLVADALIRPVAASGVNALGLAGDGTGGSVSQLLGFSSAAGQVSNLLGLGGGAGGGLAALANTPLWGGNVAGPAFNGIAASGAPTLGALAGGIGGGFMAGSMLGGLLAGDSAARQTNAQLGAGGGALAGAAIGSIFPGIGTVLGGLIGGALGGGAGGLIGPGAKTNAFGYSLTATGGQLGLSGLSTTGDGAGGAEAFAQAQATLAGINATLAALGLSVSDNNRAVTGGGDRPSDGSQSANFQEALGTFRFTSGDATVNRALSSRPEAGFEEAVGIAQFVQGLYTQLGSAAEPASEFALAMLGIQQAFDPAIERARELALETDALVAAQRKQAAELVEQQARAFRAATESTTVRFFRAIGRDQDADLLAQQLAGEQDIRALEAELKRIGTSAEDLTTQIARREEVLALERLEIQNRYAQQAAEAERQAAQARIDASRSLYEQLAFGDLGGLSPEARRQAAGLALDNARGALLDGATTDEIAEFSRVAQATLPVIRDFEGISGNFASVVQLVTDTLREFSPEGDSGGLAALIDLQVDSNSELVSAVRQGNADIAGQIENLADQIRAIVAKKA